MAVNQDYLEYILDQLSQFGEVQVKKMFGGAGLFYNGLMFGMMASDKIKLKVDDSNKKDYISKGLKAHFSEKKKKGMPYWEVPVDVIEDQAQLKKWALKSYAAALNAQNKSKS